MTQMNILPRYNSQRNPLKDWLSLLMESMFKAFNQNLLITIFFITFLCSNLSAQDTEEFFSRPAPNYPSHDPLIGWIDSRNSQSLNGKWHYIVDPINKDFQKSLSLEDFQLIKLKKIILRGLNLVLKMLRQ